ncbi:hypothetical protein [Chryseolinea sp. H1M3-3]|uniref:OB-fold protein n=1 Tax=Chryseolinea sp. H1M3-3 TaxID=3034144 RepID=UPI0023EB3BF8|nr:hypothetical protein [Chryseolinea sp. H1M3-3]
MVNNMVYLQKLLLGAANHSLTMRTTVIILIISIAGVIIVGYRLYNKEHRSVEKEQSIRIDAVQLFKSFETDEVTANLKYLDKVVEVSGEVSEVMTNQMGASVLLLETDNPLYGVSCTMANGKANVRRGMQVSIKGICTGYLSDVVITQGILSE